MWYKFSQEEYSGQQQEITNFSNYLSEKYNASVRLYLKSNGDLKLDNLVVPKENRKKGIGTNIMQEIIAFADKNKMRLVLTTAVKDNYVGTTSSGRLKKFYKRFDFTENKGKDYSISENMLRVPKGKYASEQNNLVTRYHYTDSDETLEKILRDGIKVDKSRSWQFGDPKAIWSNPYYIEGKPVVEFLEDPKNIHGDQYQFVDVPPERIIKGHKSWHPTLKFVLDNFGAKDGIERIYEAGIENDYPYNLILKELKKTVQ